MLLSLRSRHAGKHRQTCQSKKRKRQYFILHMALHPY
jgi:hypothetical protein